MQRGREYLRSRWRDHATEEVACTVTQAHSTAYFTEFVSAVEPPVDQTLEQVTRPVNKSFLAALRDKILESKGPNF